MKPAGVWGGGNHGWQRKWEEAGDDSAWSTGGCQKKPCVLQPCLSRVLLGPCGSHFVTAVGHGQLPPACSPGQLLLLLHCSFLEPSRGSGSSSACHASSLTPLLLTMCMPKSSSVSSPAFPLLLSAQQTLLHMSSPSCRSLQHGAPRSHLLHPVNYYKGSDEGERAPKSSVKEKIISSPTAMSQPTPATMEPPVLPGETKAVFGVADIIVVVLYFIFVLAVGIWVSACSEWVQLCLGQHLILPRPFLGTKVSACRRHPLHTPLSHAIMNRPGR